MNAHPRHRTHSRTVNPGAGVLAASRAQCGLRVQSPAANTPKTHAKGGCHHGTTCLGNPRPPAHIPPRRGTCSLGAVLWGRHRPPGPQCIHRAHRGPATPPHAGSARGLHANTTGSPTPTQHVCPVHTPPTGPRHHGGNTNKKPPTTPATAPQTCHSSEPQVQVGGLHSHPAH